MEKDIRPLNEQVEKSEDIQKRLEEELEERVEFACWTACRCNAYYADTDFAE